MFSWRSRKISIFFYVDFAAPRSIAPNKAFLVGWVGGWRNKKNIFGYTSYMEFYPNTVLDFVNFLQTERNIM